eukprot:TRINITY_DN67732_c6_g2_i2.p1 TRINITY_DN67732_c6_g2~~TRINITY_DN67732_c6_g2_i2.p1  ORF type:complete len:601 (-),score=11.13 TRINITY_DN67732_c6_g2_i2:337-1965(-)
MTINQVALNTDHVRVLHPQFLRNRHLREMLYPRYLGYHTRPSEYGTWLPVRILVLAYIGAIEQAAFTRQFQLIPQLFARMKLDHVPVTVDVFSAVIMACGHACQNEAMESWYEHLLEVGLQPDMALLDRMMRSYVLMGRPHGADSVIKRMEEFEYKRSAASYAIQLNAYLRMKNWEAVDELLPVLQEKAIPLTPGLFNMLLKVYNARDDTTNVEKLLAFAEENSRVTDEQVMQQKWAVPLRSRTTKPSDFGDRDLGTSGTGGYGGVGAIEEKLPLNDELYLRLIDTYGARKDWEKIDELLDLMQRRKHPLQERHVHALVTVYKNGEQWEKIHRLEQALEDLRVKFSSHLVGRFVDAYLAQDDAQAANATLRRAHEAGVPLGVGTCNVILQNARARRQPWDTFVQPVLKLMAKKKIEPDETTYAVLCKLYVLNDDLPGLNALHRTMAAKDITLQKRGLTSCVGMYRDKKNWEGVAWAIDYICKHNVPIDTFLLKLLWTCGKLQGGFDAETKAKLEKIEQSMPAPKAVKETMDDISANKETSDD